MTRRPKSLALAVVWSATLVLSGMPVEAPNAAAVSVTGVALPAAAQLDIAPPELVSFSVEPTQIDASSSSVAVVVTAVITDNLSGLSYEGDGTPDGYTSNASISSPALDQIVIGCPCFTRVSGDTYTQTLTFPQGAEAGIWKDWNLYLGGSGGQHGESG